MNGWNSRRKRVWSFAPKIALKTEIYYFTVGFGIQLVETKTWFFTVVSSPIMHINCFMPEIIKFSTTWNVTWANNEARENNSYFIHSHFFLYTFLRKFFFLTCSSLWAKTLITSSTVAVAFNSSSAFVKSFSRAFVSTDRFS